MRIVGRYLLLESGTCEYYRQQPPGGDSMGKDADFLSVFVEPWISPEDRRVGTVDIVGVGPSRFAFYPLFACYERLPSGSRDIQGT